MGARKKKSKKPSGTKAERLFEETSFFIDECLGRQLGEALRAAGWLVEFHHTHFTEGTPDDEWIPAVAARGWVALTKDKAIRRKQSERDKVMATGLRIFTLPSGSITGEQMTEIYVDNRLRIGRFLKDHPGPFIAVVTKDAVTAVAVE